MSYSSTSINPFTVPLGHAPRPKCRCESCTRIRIGAMKDGHILIAHIDQIDRLTRDALKRNQEADRRLRFINEIVAAAVTPRFAGSGSSSLPVSSADGKAAAGVLRISSS